MMGSGHFAMRGGRMNAKRKQAKTLLKNADLQQYHSIIKRAKLTARQQKVAHYLFRKGLMRYQIAQKIEYCEEVVRNDIAVVYDRVVALMHI